MLNHFLVIATACTGFCAVELTQNITSEIPVIENPTVRGFKKIADVAHYKNADWSQVVGIAKGITIEEAYDIAENNSAITYFFRTKGSQMILEKEDGSYRVFHQGDTVFFGGKPWWGAANGLADGYIRADH